MHIIPPYPTVKATILLTTKIVTPFLLLLITFIPPTHVPLLCRVLQFLFFAFYLLVFATIFYTYYSATWFWVRVEGDNYV